MRKAILTTATLGLLGLGLAPAQATTPRITAEVKTVANNTLTPQESRAVSVAAGRLIKHAFDAQTAVAENAKEEALEDVGKALTLVDIIEKASPSYTVTADIAAGGIAYHNEDVVTPKVIPIFDELDKVSLIAPLRHIKAEADKPDTSKSPLEVRRTQLDESRISLDLLLAKAGLKLAKKEIETGEFEKAGRALNAVLDSVFFTDITTDLPIERARENLMLAKTKIEHGNKKDAKVLLDEAAKELETYGKNQNSVHKKELMTLREEIRSLSARVESDHEGAIAKITEWWDKLGAMFN